MALSTPSPFEVAALPLAFVLQGIFAVRFWVAVAPNLKNLNGMWR
jgi:hypothetical protein